MGGISSIYCKTKANPAPVRFSWQFHSSPGPLNLARPDRVMEAGDFETSDVESVLSYRVDTEADYGRLVCRAENEAEGAAEPCIFIVTPSVRPGILSGCKMMNKTWDSLHIECRMTGASAGTAMGLAEDQYEYVATVIERASNMTRVVTFPRPDFNLSKLEPGTHYSIQLFAQNKIGSGPAITLLADTQRLAEKRTAESKIALQSLQGDKDGAEAVGGDTVVVILIGVIVAVILVLGCVTTTMVLVIKQRRRFESRSHDSSSLGSGHSSHLGADVDSLQSAALVRAGQAQDSAVKHQKSRHGDQRDRSGSGSALFEDGFIAGQVCPSRSNSSSRQRLVASNSKESYSHPSSGRTTPLTRSGGYSTGNREPVFPGTGNKEPVFPGTGNKEPVFTGTLPRGSVGVARPMASVTTLPRGPRLRSQECLVLSCQNVNVLHPETAMETFPHMLEPPSTFKDKCHEVGGSDDSDTSQIQTNAMTSTHL